MEWRVLANYSGKRVIQPGVYINSQNTIVRKDYSIKTYYVKGIIECNEKEKKLSKTSRHSPIRREQRFNTEIACLTSLEKNFTNTYNIDYYPFPKIIDIDYKKNIIYMSYCGNISYKNKTQRVNSQSSANCIVHNLKKNNIIHKDINSKNICINESGNIFLIDFDACHIDNGFVLNEETPLKYTSEKSLYEWQQIPTTLNTEHWYTVLKNNYSIDYYKQPADILEVHNKIKQFRDKKNKFEKIISRFYLWNILLL